MQPLTAFTLLAIGATCMADTIRLRNGTELEGVIIGEEADHYVAMVQVTKTIRDERKIPKSTVLEIVGEKKDESAFEAIASLTPTPDLLGPEEYERRIENTMAFTSEFPSSPLAKKARVILEELQHEAAVVRAGGIKFEGKLIPAEERIKKAYTLDSEIAANSVIVDGDAGRRTAALRAWDELAANFGTSRAFLDTKDYAITLMKTQLAAIDKELDTFDARMKQRADGLERTPLKDRTRTEAILKEQSDNYLRIIAAEKEAKIRWISLDPNHKEPLIQMKGLLEREIKRLETLPTSQLPDGDHAWESAWTTLQGSPSPDDVRSAMDTARKGQLPQTYIDRLQSMIPQ